ncbi:serine/threonine-protein phosphatase [Dysgonomonas sp. GY75]|uniref:PP2C family protein-serine/threonine phosphatase n=1 Tax=Dysgonomonas sp. GY75 TaxID=2780419 RepID=UPI00188342F9|nr:protein phosphatase 2C domain-containing protein [Dysgonomonas sp. GY75]MBF0649241.1 serine/threonine-protein phosphatase [Dysgonomonas sp. GY75]
MMNTISYTNKGLRSKNEDCLLSEQLSPDISFHIIADGMGGYNYGEKAAKIVVDTLFSQISQTDFSSIVEESIIGACERANLKLREEGAKLSSKMGATFAAVLILKEKVFAFWMGDSRIYQYNASNRLLFQSEDHSLINELRLSRKLAISEIRKYDSIVTRSLTGVTMENPPQIETLQHSPKDKFILCSDGLHKQTNIDAILNMAQEDLLSYLASVDSKMNDNYSIIIVN